MHVAFFDPSRKSFCHVSHGENIFITSVSVVIILLVTCILIFDEM